MALRPNLSLNLLSRVRGAPGPFAPSDISNLDAWYDASDAATISATGALVDQWNDKSGNGYHLTAAGGNRPSTGTRTQNSLNVIDADGTNQMEVSGVVMNTSFSIFIVGVVDSVNNAQDSLLAMDAARS